MAKRDRSMTSQKYKRWIKEGRGSGEGENYKPWLTIRDVPSRGRSHRIPGIKIKRTHHLLSDYERDYFYIAEFSDYVIDIREQYPLPLTQTTQIAEELEIEHPHDIKTKFLNVITTDMLLTVSDGKSQNYIARTIKQIDELNNERQMEKFEIERRFWASKKISWGIVTEEQINKTIALNISSIRSYYDLSELAIFSGMTVEKINRLRDLFLKDVLNQYVCIRSLCDDFDDRLCLNPSTGISIFNHLVIQKKIAIPILNSNIDYDNPVFIKSYEKSDIEVVL